MTLAYFIRCDSGATVVEWTALVAMLVGLSVAVLGVVSQGTESAAVSIASELQTDVVSTTFNHPLASRVPESPD